MGNNKDTVLNIQKKLKQPNLNIRKKPSEYFWNVYIY